MKKLRQKYKSEKDKQRKSGNGSVKKEWKYFSKMDIILSHRHNVTPPSVIDSSVEKRPDCDEDNGKVE